MSKGNDGTLLVIAGEASGDLHGGAVLEALRELRPGLKTFGIGGKRMAAAGQEQLFTTDETAILGFVEVLRHLPFIFRMKRTLEAEIESRQPQAALLIDYPGFNLRFAKRLRRFDIPILYYIAPQVWAWGARRVPKMARLIDHLAVVFPFELPIFANAGLQTSFVGHPLLESLRPGTTRADFRAKFTDAGPGPWLGLLPGSRLREVQTLLPDMLATAALLHSRIAGLNITLACAPDQPASLYEAHLTAYPNLPVRLVPDATYDVMAHSDACLVASGTATLETACLETPLVIVYRVSQTTFAIARRLVRLPNIGLANIVAGEQVAPELVQDAFQPETAADLLEPMLTDNTKNAAMRQALARVRQKLGEPGASKRVAALACELLDGGRR